MPAQHVKQLDFTNFLNIAPPDIALFLTSARLFRFQVSILSLLDKVRVILPDFGSDTGVFSLSLFAAISRW